MYLFIDLFMDLLNSSRFLKITCFLSQIIEVLFQYFEIINFINDA